MSPARALSPCPSSTEQRCLPGSSTLRSPSLLEAAIPQRRGARQPWRVAAVSRAVLSLPSKQHLAGPGQPPGSLWRAAHLLFTAKASLPCHGPQRSQASWSLHITLTVPLPRRARGWHQLGEWQGGCSGWWPSSGLGTAGHVSANSKRCSPRPGLRGEGGYNSLSSAGVWEQGWIVSGKGRLPLSPDPT